MNLLVVDNFDSFTYMLVDYLCQAGAHCRVVRNDEPMSRLTRHAVDGVVLSPGPGTPRQAGRLMEVITHYHRRVPMLGVCLGHQALGEFFGAGLAPAQQPMHGKVSTVRVQTEDVLFQNIPAQFSVTRYHSLVLRDLPAQLVPLATTGTGVSTPDEVMALRHRTLPLWGVQFHPEAALTEYGLQLIKKLDYVWAVYLKATSHLPIVNRSVLMNYQIREEAGFRYVDEGKGDVLLLLHGLFGALSNWDGVINGFRDRYRVVIPLMPIYEMPARQASLEGLVNFIEQFVARKGLSDLTLLGNSLGGHLALLYTFRHPDQVRRIVLTGSSGLFENGMGGSFPKRGSYDYIAERVAYTFYDPNVASKELIDEVFGITSSIPKCMNIVAIAKSAQRNNVAKELFQIQVPTLLVWGLNDTITPTEVGYEFNRLISSSELYFIDQCCHAPMMECPDRFNELLNDWLARHPVYSEQSESSLVVSH